MEDKIIICVISIQWRWLFVVARFSTDLLENRERKNVGLATKSDKKASEQNRPQMNFEYLGT